MCPCASSQKTDPLGTPSQEGCTPEFKRLCQKWRAGNGRSNSGERWGGHRQQWQRAQVTARPQAWKTMSPGWSRSKDPEVLKKRKQREFSWCSQTTWRESRAPAELGDELTSTFANSNSFYLQQKPKVKQERESDRKLLHDSAQKSAGLAVTP